MKLGLMQSVDRWLGVPLVRLARLGTPRSICLGGDATGERPPKRVVIAKFIGLGSIILSFPLLKRLRAAGVEIVFLTFPSNAGILASSGLAHQIWVIDPALTRLPFSIARTLWKLWSLRPDAYVDLEPTANFSAILGALARVRRRVGLLCGKPLRESLFSHSISLAGGRHMSENYLLAADLLGVVGGKDSESAASDGSPSSRNQAESLPEFKPVVREMRQPRRTNGRQIVLNMTTSDLGSYHRSWPELSWAALARELLAEGDVTIYLPGLKSDHAKLESFRSMLGDDVRVKNLAGSTNLHQLQALIAESDLVVSLDSGIAHLSAWIGTPLVCLFGPESPALYGPLSHQVRIIWKGLHCSPCCTVATEKHTRCRDNQCMKLIPVNQVKSACLDLLSKGVSATV